MLNTPLSNSLKGLWQSFFETMIFVTPMVIGFIIFWWHERKEAKNAKKTYDKYPSMEEMLRIMREEHDRRKKTEENYNKEK